MPLTQAQALTRVRDRLDESTARQWTDAQLRRWLNDATKDISRKSESIQDRQTIAGVIGTAEYSLSDNCVRVHRVEWKPTSGSDTRRLEYADVRNMDGFGWSQRTLQGSYPWAYTVWGSGAALKLIIHPSPSLAGNFTVWYYRLAAALAEDTADDANDELEIPEGWDDIVLDYVEYRALRRDRDSRWVEAKAIYDENLSVMYDNTRRWADEAGMVMPDISPLPAWLHSFE